MTVPQLLSLVCLALVLTSCRRQLEARKPVVTLSISDLISGGEPRIRAGCESIYPDDSGSAQRCTRTFLNSGVIAGLCDRVHFDGGASDCVALMKVSGRALVLESTEATYLVVDGARALEPSP